MRSQGAEESDLSVMLAKFIAQIDPQAAQAQVVCHMILRNSGHSKIIRVCMGIFTICFRKHKYYKILKKNTLSYFHGVLLAVCALTFR